MKQVNIPVIIAFILMLSNLALAKKIDIGGQIRSRVEHTNDQLFNKAEDTFTLLRTRLHASFKPTLFLKGFVQFQDSRVFGEEVSTAAALNQIDLHQGYIDILFDNVATISLPFTLRIGRQVLSFGNQRLIGAFEWSNVARAFDAIQLIYRKKKLKAHVWASKIEDTFIPPSATGGSREEFFGSYITYQLHKKHWVDVYALADLDEATTNQGGDTYTFGGRLNGSFFKHLDYDVEGAYQFGDIGTSDISAFAVHAALGYTFSFLGKLRLGGEYNYSSGDDSKTDSDVETFDNLFPTNHGHYGYMDLVSWRNTNNFAGRLSYTPSGMNKLTLGVDYWYFDLADNADDAYRASGAVLRTTVAGASKHLGQELDTTLKYKWKKDLSILAGYSHFFSGDFLKDTVGKSDDIDFAYTQIVLNF